MKFTDPQQTEEAAQRLLNDRMDYVRAAITARGVLDEAREALKEAEKNDTAAFQAAVTTGAGPPKSCARSDSPHPRNCSVCSGGARRRGVPNLHRLSQHGRKTRHR